MTVLSDTFPQTPTSHVRSSLVLTLVIGLLALVSGLIPTAFVLLAM